MVNYRVPLLTTTPRREISCNRGTSFVSRDNTYAPPPRRKSFAPSACAPKSLREVRKVFARKKPGFSEFSWPAAREGARDLAEEGKVVGAGGSYGGSRAVSGGDDAGGGI